MQSRLLVTVHVQVKDKQMSLQGHQQIHDTDTRLSGAL